MSVYPVAQARPGETGSGSSFLLSPISGIWLHVRLPECSFGLNWGWEDGVGVLCSGCIVSVKVYIAWCLWAG